MLTAALPFELLAPSAGADSNRQPTVPITHNLRPANKSIRGFQRKSPSQGMNKSRIRFGRNHFQRRKATLTRENQHCSDQKPSDHKIWPCVQRPLTGPNQSHVVRKRKQVGDRPLVAIRTACPNQVGKQMQMKTEYDQERRFDFLLGEYRSTYRDDDSEAQIVPKGMVIIAPPVQWMAGVSRQPIGDNPQPVHVRHDTGPRYQRTITFAERRRRIGDRPAHEKMRDRAH
jgi:hypothetical protein